MPSKKKTAATIKPENLAAVKKLIRKLPTLEQHQAAQKRVIKAEISALKTSLKTVTRDFKKAHTLNARKCAIAVRAAKIAMTEYRKAAQRLGNAETREAKAITKRIAILNGRLNS